MMRPIENKHTKLMSTQNVKEILAQFQKCESSDLKIKEDEDAGTAVVECGRFDLFRGIAKDGNTWLVSYDSNVIHPIQD